MRNSGWKNGEPWFTCAMCGMDYPISYAVWQGGKARCTYLPCVDDGQEDAKPPANPKPPRIAEIYPAMPWEGD